MSRDILHAASTGDIEAIRRLIKDGCDVNIVDNDGSSPLHCAAKKGHDIVVKTLLLVGADANVKDEREESPLHYAAIEGHNAVVKTLLEGGGYANLENKSENSPLHNAAKEGHNVVVKTLLQGGADVNFRNKNRESPLHYATGRKDVMKTLLQAGADVCVKNEDCTTPLHWAAEKGDNDVVKTLIQAGADFSDKNKVGDTSLHLAAVRGHNGVVKTLINAGADLSVKDLYGNTSLHRATGGGHNDVVKTLIDTGADVNVKTVSGSTPLHRASGGGHNNVVKTLINAGADLNVKNLLRNTPLHSAAEEGHNDVVKTLIQAGADLNIKNSNGNTAKEMAATSTKELLQEYENLLEKAPQEVRKLGVRATAKYVFALMENAAISNVIRLMLVGHFGVGKTTIAMNLLERKVKHIDSTDGIEVYINQCIYDKEEGKWYTEIKYNESLRGFDGVIRLDIVDFAGQLIFYTTHQTYLTSRGLYLLVFNLAMGLESNVDDEDLHPGKNQRRVIDFLEFWITTIKTYAKGEQTAFPKIILLGTHRDKVKDESVLDLIKKEIVEKFNSMVMSTQLVVRDDLFLSATNLSDDARKSIRDIILEEGMKYKEFGEPIPASWDALQEKLMKLKQDNIYIVSLDSVRKINSELDTPLDEEELDIFIKYLHNIGYILYFSTSVLKEKVILDPKVVIDAMRSFITCERFITSISIRNVWKQMRESGEVKKSHILRMWTRKGLTEHSEHLLAIMKRLDLICEPKIYRFGQKLSLDFFVVPSMINAINPVVPVIQVPEDSRVVLVFSSETLLPPAIFNRLVCSCLTLWTVFNKHLYNGLAVLKIGRCHLMEMRRQMNEVEVTFMHIEATKHPDMHLCIAIKQFLAETIEQIVAVYNIFVDGPISCNSSCLDAFLQRNDTLQGNTKCEDKEITECNCDAYTDWQLQDVHLMRIAVDLNRVDLRLVCTALLNDAEYSIEIEDNFKSFNGDVKRFYALQKWKKRARKCSVSEFRQLLRDYLDNVSEHIICQAMREEVLEPDTMDSAILVSKVYPEFLDAVADNIALSYMQLGLELGFTLREIERLKMDNGRVLEIARAMMEMWSDKHKEDATVLNLAKAFYRSGDSNLKWMESEFDVQMIIQQDSGCGNDREAQTCHCSLL